MKEVLDLLLIHVPKFSGYYRPYGDYMTINLLPMGTLGLADMAVQHGFKTRILHLGLEFIERGRFSAIGYLKNKAVRVVAMPLHWHQQSYDVMAVAEEIKRNYPQAYVVLGGYTAGFFHHEIMTDFPAIDAIIRGDAETPLMGLMKALKSEESLEHVPNLTWRDGENVRTNPLSYVASEKDLDNFSYARLQLLKDSKTYVRYMGVPFVWAKGISKEDNRKYFHLGRSIFSLNVGRGCSGNCTWCGGGAEAQKEVNGRGRVVFRSPESVFETIAEAKEMGYEIVHMAFDPGKEGERYYLDLFPLLRKRGLRIGCYFESFSLPSERLIHEFCKTFESDGSILALSPETGDERVRHLNKSFPYSNEHLMKTISTAERYELTVDAFFAMGIPGEDYRGLARTASLRKEIRRRFKNVGRTWTSPISMEPASPWYQHPEEFGVVSNRHGFADFYKDAAPGGGGIGYYIPEYAGNGRPIDAAGFETLLRETKCRDHCSLHPNPSKASSPFLGRLYCRYLHWRTGGGRG